MATTQLSASFRFQEVCLLKSKHPLGHGAYGVVYEATCDELDCVAKCFHPHICGGGNEQAREVFKRDLQFLCGLNHPNLVQYLGTHAEPAADNVVLLMEKLDSSLCHFLHNHRDSPLPFHQEVTICRDIALGLRYLHGNGIWHHNLSSSNVLLLGTLRAKVSDFGLAKICGTTQIQTRASNSWAYMPPEMLMSVAQASESVDEFSLGVCMIEVLTRQHPDPGPLMEEVASQKSMTFKLVPEVNRRHNHISLIDSNHPMLSIALDSISDDPHSRPSAKVVCRKLQQMKESQDYVKCTQDKTSSQESSDWLLIEFDEPAKQRMQDRIIHQQQQLEEKERHLNDMRQILSIKEQQLNARDQKIVAKEAEIDVLSAELVTAEKQAKKEKERAHESEEGAKENKLLAEKEQKIADLEAQISILQKSSTPSPSSTKQFTFANGSPQNHKTESQKYFNTRRLSLSWKRGKSAPVSFQPQSSVAIGHNGKVYISHCNIERASGQVLEYSQSADTWQVLPVVPKSEFTIVVFQGALVAVGGSRNLRKVNTLHVFSSTCLPDQEEPRWLDNLYPGMPTARAFPSCASHGQYLLVAGGEVQGMAVTEVEVLDFRTKRWEMVRRLPKFGHYTRMMSCTTGDNGDSGHTYFLGGFEDGTLTAAAFRCFIPNLIEYTRQHDRVLWTTVTSLPVAGAACIAMEDQLLAFGGYEKRTRRQSNAIYCYQPPPLDKWERSSATLPYGFSRGLVAVTSCGGKRAVVIVGGNTASGESCFTFSASF